MLEPAPEFRGTELALPWIANACAAPQPPGGGGGGAVLPAISVCICTRNRSEHLARCLESLRCQTVRGTAAGAFETVIVDSGSSPPHAAAIERLAAAATPAARLVRLGRPGVSAARNAAAQAAAGAYIAFLDDDARAAPDWIEQIARVLAEEDRPPAVLGGRVLPHWERPLPEWWPDSLRGVLSIIELEGRGEYRTPDLPPGLQPWAVNMVVERAALLDAGGFDERVGRLGDMLLSDEEVELAWRLQARGRPARYDSRLLVYHYIHADRLSPEWLLSRLYWQGFSTVITRRLLGQPVAVWREFGRRLAIEILCAPAAFLPRGSTRMLGLRWRLAYAKGFTRSALGCVAGKRASLLRAALPGKRRGRSGEEGGAPRAEGAAQATAAPASGAAAGEAAVPSPPRAAAPLSGRGGASAAPGAAAACMTTVILATRDRAAILPRVLGAFARLAPPEGGWKLVVVDNGSTDGTAPLLRAYAGLLPLTVLSERRPGKNRALNTALTQLEGDLVVCTDDDVIPAPDWLQRLRHAADTHLDATMFGGTVELDWPGPAPAWLTAGTADLSVLYARNARPSGPCDHTAIFGPCMAVRRRVFEDGMRFSEAMGPDASLPLYPMGGETELLRRLSAAGHRGWFEAEARVRHIIRPEQLSESWILDRAYRYGYGEGRNHLGRGAVAPLLLRRLAYLGAAAALRGLPPSPGRLRVLFRERCLAGALAGRRGATAAAAAAMAAGMPARN